MLKREDLIIGMSVITLENHHFPAKGHSNNSQEFPAGSIFKIKALNKITTNPNLYLEAEDKSQWVAKNFKSILAIIDKYSEANAVDQNIHNKKVHDNNILTSIKKLAEYDNLNGLLLILKDNPDFLGEKKNVRTLMAYAILSKKLEILTYGFEHNWFSAINWNENIIKGEISAPPFSYAIQKSSIEVQKFLISQGARLDNKYRGNSHITITAMREQYAAGCPKDLYVELKEFEKVVEIIKFKERLDLKLPEKKPAIKKVKI